ncbi:fumarylacetoacetate hydrolase family protein [Streptomyces sp. NPDC094034]|uniref:fumarylacetoacetate hydrolase family protein n=1 Tax=Streptomyces sp. NPDC094034 TaxID=3155309 RepID=UPI00331D6B49
MMSIAPTHGPLPFTPGKIIAVHISYESRAAQRGRRPPAPSYFFKPSSSLATSGDAVERPEGTELLSFEGEIALIMGTPARSVSPADAWNHVAWVTASNDWGLYDLRSNDKGSNVRNKGRDGYTPVGPQLIDARSVDPAALRVRTWLNGELVQEGDTTDLIFPFSQIIADLSQHLTLAAGDVILTGTPAGASVAAPGDIVEVEVDAPHVIGELSSGKLTSRVIRGRGGFDPAIGSLPLASDLQREEAWGSREAAGLSDAAPVLPVELRDKLLEAPVAGLSQQLRKRGLDNVSIDGVRATRPGTKLVGVAKTLRFVPSRADLFRSHGGGYNAQKRAFDAVQEGEVIVIEARSEGGSGTLGDVLALRALARGAAGVVTDGGVRDYATVAGIGLPIFSLGPHPAVLGRKHVPWDTDLTIACGGATVQPGDIIVGDDDGVIVIPSAIAEEVADAALAQESEDAWIAEQVAAGNSIDGLFPMNAEWRAKYEAAVKVEPC